MCSKMLVEKCNFHFYCNFALEWTCCFTLKCFFWQCKNCWHLLAQVLNIRFNLLYQFCKIGWMICLKSFTLKRFSVSTIVFWAIRKKTSNCGGHECIQSCKSSCWSFYYAVVGKRFIRKTTKPIDSREIETTTLSLKNWRLSFDIFPCNGSMLEKSIVASSPMTSAVFRYPKMRSPSLCLWKHLALVSSRSSFYFWISSPVCAIFRKRRILNPRDVKCRSCGLHFWGLFLLKRHCRTFTRVFIQMENGSIQTVSPSVGKMYCSIHTWLSFMQTFLSSPIIQKRNASICLCVRPNRCWTK